MQKISLLVFILVFGSLLFSQEFVGSRLEKGAVNYADRTITATGVGFIPENAINPGQARRAALRIAKQDALRQLIEIVNGIVVTSETTVKGAMLDDVIRSQVEGVIRGAYQVGDPRYLSDTSVEVSYQVKMSGISEILTPVIKPAAPPEAGTVAKIPSRPETPLPTATTGIILDVRGFNIRPALAPKVLDQDGRVIYGPGNYSREYAVMNGVVGYSKSLDTAKADPRVKGNPLVIKAVAASGKNHTDVVIGKTDGQRIQSANSSYGVLKDCRVIILLD